MQLPFLQNCNASKYICYGALADWLSKVKLREKLFLQYVPLYIIKHEKYCKKWFGYFCGFVFHNMSLFFSKSNIQIKQAEPQLLFRRHLEDQAFVANFWFNSTRVKIRRPNRNFPETYVAATGYLQSISSGREMDPRKKKKKDPKAAAEHMIPDMWASMCKAEGTVTAV